MLLISDHVTKKLNKRTLIIKPATPKTFGNIAKVHSNHKAMISSRVLVKTLASNIKKKSLSKSSRPDFTTPSWLKLLDLPTNEFNLEIATYREITNVIKMQQSASACPFDRISVITLKKLSLLMNTIMEIYIEGVAKYIIYSNMETRYNNFNS